MKSVRLIGALTAVAALAVPASALAHGSVYESTAKVVPDESNPSTTVDETRYMITNHGFTYALSESNHATGNGMIDYKVLPSAYRKRPGFTKTMLLAEGDTGAQPHATCRGVTELDEAAILAWQGSEPFYNYVPWQKGSAGLEDDPATWIKVVKDTVGVDLSTENPTAACTRIGGTYTPADAIVTSAASLASGTVEHETAPLNAQIGSLTKAVTDADAANAALQGLLDAARVEIAKLAVAATPVKATLPSAKLKRSGLGKRGTPVTLSGVPGRRVAVELAIGQGQARKLKLKSSVLASAKATFGADGTAKVTLTAKQSVRKALGKLKRPAAYELTAVSGDRIASATGTLSR